MLETSIARATVERAGGKAGREQVRLALEARGLVAGINGTAADRVRADAGRMVEAFLASLPVGEAGRAWREWATVAARIEANADAQRMRRWIEARRAARPRPSADAEIRKAADRILLACQHR